jgi:hypothetical protein
MRAKKKISSTLGDLIAAVTEEVTRVTGDTERTEILVSYVLADLFAKGRVRLRKGSALAMS